MNKITVVLGVAAVATLAGCKDPSYKAPTSTSQDEVKVVEPADPTPVIEVKTTEQPVQPKVVKVEPVPAQPLPPPPAIEPVLAETTTYIVQPGDYLGKISARYNIRIAAIKKLNPSIKKDVIRVGQKLKLPGKIDIGAQKPIPAPAKAGKPVAKKADATYAGATKEYVVKSGDTLGAIAYGNGTTIRQLKKMNGLTKDSLSIGQKLKVPAAGAAAKKAAEPKAKAPVEAAKPAEPVVAPTPAAQDPVVDATPAPTADVTPADPTTAPAVDATPAPAADVSVPVPAAPATTTYAVQEGDDMTGVSIRFGVSAAAIRELNNLPDDAQLKPGMVLKLPADAQQ